MKTINLINKEEFIKLLVKTQILSIRYVERHSNLICVTHRDLNRFVMQNKLTCNYRFILDTLEKNINEYCNDFETVREMLKILKDNISILGLDNLRLGMDSQKKFTEIEKELDSLRTKYLLFYLNEMLSIGEASKILGLNINTIKKACQTERLLNTRKTGKTWLVHLPELKKEFKTEYNDDLYKDFEF